MKKAYVFPGQGSQFPGMGKELFEQSESSRLLFEQANELTGFRITDIMFGGSEEELKQTRVTQPAIFIHSVVLAMSMGENLQPDMVAGHSLGEFSALVANRTLTFPDALKLVIERANAMQYACELRPSTMAAILGPEDKVVEEICASVDGIVVPANYNCPGQIVISGSVEAVQEACARLLEAGARRALPINVGGAFHSPLMEPARERLARAIEATPFQLPVCPVYQNVNALPCSDPVKIKENLVAQLTAPVRWTQCVQHMIADGASSFIEVGPGKVLQGLVRKISREMEVSGV